MDQIKSDKDKLRSPTVAVANHIQGGAGRSLPAVPPVQQFAGDLHEGNNIPLELPQQSAQKAESETRPPSPNNTGLPDNLKQGIENLSGISMDHVKVHYNSSKPIQMQALAYAQGSDIHLGPGQEQHLPHEAWHVIQQSQGRVQPTTQMKMGAALNDDHQLEREADEMGTAAMSQAAASSEQVVQQKTPSNPVVQRRLPVIAKSMMAFNFDVSKDLLLHGMRYMTDAEKIALAAIAGSADVEGAHRDLTASIKACQDSDLLFEAYMILKDVLTVDNKFQPEKQGASDPAAVQNEQIIASLPQIVARIGNARGSAEMIATVFGPGERTAKVLEVYGQVAAAIQVHIDANTCPVKIMGNENHSKWIGAEGMASPGAERIVLEAGTVAKLAAGNVDAQASLVHELSHSASNTLDNAYNVDSCFRLTAVKKANNATSYEHGYIMANGDAQGYAAKYAEAAQVQAQDAVADDSDIVRRKKVVAREVIALVVEVWNNCDNAFLSAQRIVDKQGETLGDLKLVDLAAVPHTFTLPNRRLVLALLEDRTHALKKYKTLKGIRQAMRGIEAEVLERPTNEVFAHLAKDDFNMSEAHLADWAAKVANPLAHILDE